MSNFTPEFMRLRTMVLFILQNPARYEWTLQGFGMLRLHLPNNHRLHVWEPALAYPGVSMIHDHLQWGLESTVISGSLLNYRFDEEPDHPAYGEEYEWSMIKAGVGGGLEGDARTTRLGRLAPERYQVGQSYSQHPGEIHETIPRAGTVTVMRKTPTPQRDSARVFWRKGEKWGTAEPRSADPQQLSIAIEYALSKWKRLPDEEFGV